MGGRGEGVVWAKEPRETEEVRADTPRRLLGSRDAKDT